MCEDSSEPRSVHVAYPSIGTEPEEAFGCRAECERGIGGTDLEDSFGRAPKGTETVEEPARHSKVAGCSVPDRARWPARVEIQEFDQILGRAGPARRCSVDHGARDTPAFTDRFDQIAEPIGLRDHVGIGENEDVRSGPLYPDISGARGGQARPMENDLDVAVVTDVLRVREIIVVIPAHHDYHFEVTAELLRAEALYAARQIEARPGRPERQWTRWAEPDLDPSADRNLACPARELLVAPVRARTGAFTRHDDETTAEPPLERRTPGSGRGRPPARRGGPVVRAAPARPASSAAASAARGR